MVDFNASNTVYLVYSVQYMVYFGGAFCLFSQIINPASFQELYMIENSYGWQQKILVDKGGTRGVTAQQSWKQELERWSNSVI